MLVKEKAFAKINLYLDVFKKRSDGFHDIKTVMHSVSLFDELHILAVPAEKNEIKIEISGNASLSCGSDNLVFKAAQAFLDHTGKKMELQIKLFKKIPVAAGLAGGSSDAAATLRALNRCIDSPLSLSELLDLGSRLGSDVPYCILGGTALCEGRGEKVTPIFDGRMPKMYFVIALGDESVSTPAAYRALDTLFSDFSDGTEHAEKSYLELLDFISGERTVLPTLYNIFEESAKDSCPGYIKIKDRLSDLGAVCLMSGSGPSVFGVFYDERAAKEAAELLVSDGIRAYFAHSETEKRILK